MKAEELMRFDWVRLVDDNTPRQVDWIRSGEVGLLWNKTVTPPYLEPIPLTPEILEKNGFEVTRNMSSSRNKDVWSLRVSQNKAFYIIEHHNKKQFPYFWIEIGSNSDIKYVHQLQHALRLCEIDKEIEL